MLSISLSPSKQRKGQTSRNLLGGQLLVPIPPPLIPEITGSSTQGAVTDFYQPVQRPRSDDVMHTEVKVQTRRLHLKRVKGIRSVRSLGTNRVTLSDLFAGFAASHPASCWGTGGRKVQVCNQGSERRWWVRMATEETREVAQARDQFCSNRKAIKKQTTKQKTSQELQSCNFKAHNAKMK